MYGAAFVSVAEGRGSMAAGGWTACCCCHALPPVVDHYSFKCRRDVRDARSLSPDGLDCEQYAAPRRRGRLLPTAQEGHSGEAAMVSSKAGT